MPGALSAMPLSGLSSTEAAERLRTFGPNRIVRETRGARLREILRMFADPMALMLAVAAVVYLSLGDRQNGIILLVALAPVLAIDVILEARSHRALRKLAAALSPKTTVIRDGAEVDILTEGLVPGDVFVIREGDVFRADGVIRISANLTVDESQLSGESDPQEKGVGAPFYAGSAVLSGHGFGEVMATGARTRYGQIADLVAIPIVEQSPLQRRSRRLVKALAVGALIASAGVFLLGLYRGEDVGHALLPAISVAISAAPEEFLLVLTIFLALGAYRLSSRNVLVRRLVAVEALGSTTIICTDKTGTLTRGHFTLEEHLPLGPGTTEDDLLVAAVLACEPHPADKLEQDIVAHCREHGIDVLRLHREWALIHDHAFDPMGKHMAHTWERHTQAGAERRLVAKGAFEGIVEHCAISAEELCNAERAHAGLASEGFRVLAVAGRAGELTGQRDADERGLTLFGLIGFRDSVRPEVPSAVEECQSAGIHVKLITGDHVLTAHAIATAAGVEHDDDWITTGDALDHLGPEEFEAKVAGASILARVRPEQKYAIVDALVRRGEIVAMAGDGINDAPALRRASIGISMGMRGTEVARATSDLVLLDDNFTSVVATVREGRRIFDNIQRAFLFLLPVKIVVMAVALTAPLLALPAVLLPVHLIWLELIVHPVAALVFEAEPAPPDLMRRPPRRPLDPLLRPAQVMASVVSAFLLATASLVSYSLLLDRGEDLARTFAIAVLMFGLAMLIWAARAGDRGWLSLPLPRTFRFWTIWCGVVVSAPLFSVWPFADQVLHLQPLAFSQWCLSAAIAAGCVIWRAFGRGDARAARA
jgi:Ca2+-transporting ATPase